jgi:hypothetical protein
VAWLPYLALCHIVLGICLNWWATYGCLFLQHAQ